MSLLKGGTVVKNSFAKRFSSLLLSVLMIVGVMPANVFAAAVMDEDYSAMTDDGTNYGWKVTTEPTHATFETLSDGVRILQTKQTRYSSGTTTNTTTDGAFYKYINSAYKSNP